MTDLDTKMIDIIERHEEDLLDPMVMIFPLPGMWHFVFGWLFSMISSGAGVMNALNYLSIDPLIQYSGTMITAVIFILSVILCTRGHRFPLYLMIGFALFSAISSSIIIMISSISLVGELFVLVFSLAGFYLLRSIMCRTHQVIIEIRMKKYWKMKKDGSYDEKLAAARKKLGYK